MEACGLDRILGFGHRSINSTKSNQAWGSTINQPHKLMPTMKREIFRPPRHTSSRYLSPVHVGVMYSSWCVGSSVSQIHALEILFNSTKGEQWQWENETLNGPKWSFSSPQADPCNDKNRVWQGSPALLHRLSAISSHVILSL